MKQEIKKRIEEINSGIVPEGYEQTDFGIFPYDWDKEKTLGSLGLFAKGQGLPGDRMSEENDVPCIGYGDIYTKYNYHFDKARNFTDIKTAENSTKIGKGTLCFTGTGETAEEIGKCVCYNGNEEIYAGGDIIIFNSKNVNPLFLAYQQYCDFSIRKKASFGQGHSVVHIHKENLEKMHVAYPVDTKEQSKIAEILMKWDDAIALQEQYIQKLEERKKVLLNQIIVNKIENREKKYTELGSILQVKGGYAFKSENYIDEGNYKIITIKNVQQGKLDLSEVDCINDMPKNIQKWQILEKGDLIISLTGNVGRTCFVNTDNCLLNQRVGKIVVDERLKYFVYSIMQTKKFIEKIKVIAQGGAQANISNDDIEEYGINLPYKDGEVDYETIDFISNTMKLFDEKLLLEKEKLEKLKLQRKAMQQYLLTGVVRVSV